MTAFIGVVLGFGAMILAIFMEAQGHVVPKEVQSPLMAFINPTGLLLVFGGTIGATLTAYRLGEVLRVMRSFIVVFTRRNPNFVKELNIISELSRSYAKEGTPALEAGIKKMPNNMLKDGINLLINGYKPEEIRLITEEYIKSKFDREQLDVDVFRTMATIAPAFGMVGTVIGLVLMMKETADIKVMMAKISIAFTCTLYGLILANAVFTPMAAKLMLQSETNLMLSTLQLEGLMLIIEKRHPIYIKDRLASYIPPGQRKYLYMDKGKKAAPPAKGK